MNYTIHDRTEGKRGCGYRKGGGIYLVSDGISSPCGKLPIKLDVCPCCSQGIKPSRGWTWVDADKLAGGKGCHLGVIECEFCPLGGEMGRAGLLWIGEKFYPTPGAFTAEAMKQGISRRLSQVPKDFKVGDTWVLVAHRKACDVRCALCGDSPKALCEQCGGTGSMKVAGIFHAFLPRAIEYVMKGTETPDELERLHKRGFTLVRVTRDDGEPLEIVGAKEGGDEE